MLRKTIFRSMPVFGSLTAVLSLAALSSFSAGPVAAAPLHHDPAPVPCKIMAQTPVMPSATEVTGTGIVTCSDGGRVSSLTVTLLINGQPDGTNSATITPPASSAMLTATHTCAGSALRRYQTTASAIVQRGSTTMTISDTSGVARFHCK